MTSHVWTPHRVPNITFATESCGRCAAWVIHHLAVSTVKSAVRKYTSAVWAVSDFSQQCSVYLDPLIAALSLEKGPVEDHDAYGFADARGGNVCVRFEHDRGLAEFSLSAVSAPGCRWSLLLVAALFPRKRMLAGGVQRLSLAEQAQLIESHWPELQSLFGPAMLASTTARLAAENDSG